MTEPTPMVRARGWGFRHAGRHEWALRDVDIDIAPGERVLLLGASGAGKSTFLHAVAGLLDDVDGCTATGQLRVDGQVPHNARDRVGLVFQDPETQLIMARAGDDVAFGPENHAVPTEEIWARVDDAMELTGFRYGRDHSTGALSGGEKQRLVLAGVVAIRPRLLLLDEPTANLDPDGAALVRETVDRIVDATGATLLVVEHRTEEWLELVDRAIVLEAGAGVTVDGPTADVFRSGRDTLAERGVWVPSYGRTRSRDRAPVPAGATALRGEDLRFRYPGAAALAVDGVNLEVRDHEVLAIGGANGSGKSTLALLLAGLLRPTSGETRVEHPSVVRRRTRGLHRWPARDLARTVGTVFQDPEHQFWTRHVRDELALGPTVAGFDAAQVQRRVDELAERLRLSHVLDANPFTLSGGEKRRLSVATALAAAPPVLVLDEPTFGQDPRTWSELVELLSSLRSAGHGIVCVSHDLDFVDVLADRQLWLRDGRISSAERSAVTPS